MADYNYKSFAEPYWVKTRRFLESMWPSIYIALNGLFFGTINFLKFLIRGFFPGR